MKALDSSPENLSFQMHKHSFRRFVNSLKLTCKPKDKNP